jgi:hypothetical protein
MKVPIVISLLLLFALSACKKPMPQGISDIRSIPSIVFHTSLADTLPKKTYDALNISNISGLKIKDLQGHDVRYFDYETDTKILLTALSEAPFDRNTILSDTLCRKLSLPELRLSMNTMSSLETESASFFWTIDPSQYDIYECIKSPFKHNILVHKKSRKVLHRVELQG